MHPVSSHPSSRDVFLFWRCYSLSPRAVAAALWPTGPPCPAPSLAAQLRPCCRQGDCRALPGCTALALWSCWEQNLAPSSQPCICRGRGRRWHARSKLLRLYLGKMLLIVAKQGTAPAGWSLAGSFCLIQPKLALIAVLLYFATSWVQVTSRELLTHPCSACSLLKM